MAALTNSELIKRMPLGDRVLKTFRVTITTAGAADEFIDTGLSHIDAVLGYSPIGTSATGTAATGSVIFSATNPTETETITVDGIEYVVNATPATTGAYSIDLSDTENTLAANFKNAINRTGTAGTDYSLYIAAHPTVSASGAAATITITARRPGSAGNAITLAAAGGSTTVSGATLTGGTDPVCNVSFVKNAEGTGVTADTDPGALGIECPVASAVIEVTVIGRP